MITIDSNPNALNSVYQPIRFQVSSNKMNPELKIRCDLQYTQNGQATWVDLASWVQDPYAGESYFIFQCERFLNSVMEIILPSITHNQTIEDTTSLVQFKATFTEMIFDQNEDYVNSDSANSGTFQATNLILQVNDQYDLDDFLLENDTKRFLSDSPYVRTGYMSQLLPFSYIEYDSENEYYRKYHLTKSPGATGNLDVVITAGPDEISRTISFDIHSRPNTNCFEFLFLNKRGGFDSFIFLNKTLKELEIDRETHLKIGTSNTLIGELSSVSITSEESRVIFSDFINDQTADWLHDVLESPVVYWVDQSTGVKRLKPIYVLNKKQVIIDEGMIQLEIQFRLSTEKINQTSFKIGASPASQVPASNEWQSTWA